MRAKLIRIVATQQPAASDFLPAETSTPESTIANDVMIVAVGRWLSLPIVPEMAGPAVAVLILRSYMFKYARRIILPVIDTIMS